MLWFWSALGGAVLWGISYAAGEYTLKNGLSATAQLALFGIVLTPFYMLLALKNGSLQTGIQVLRTNPKVLGYFALIAVCYAIANILVYWSIQQKNATVASLIEVSYPLFVALFSYVLFREAQLTTGAMIGGALIIAGVFTIYKIG